MKKYHYYVRATIYADGLPKIHIAESFNRNNEVSDIQHIRELEDLLLQSQNLEKTEETFATIDFLYLLCVEDIEEN